MTKVIPEIVSQHAEEAAFLWLLHDGAVRAPHYLLADLARLDNRVEAHLDGLRVAADPGWEICAKALEEGAAGEVFATAVLAFESGKDERIQSALNAGAAAPHKARGLVSALGWLSFDLAESHIKNLLAAEPPALQRVGLAAAAVHRQHPGPIGIDALGASDHALRARALRAVGELGLVDYHASARRNLKSEDPGCRFWAAWSGALLLNDKESVATLLAIAQTKGPYQERAVQLAVRRLDLSAAKSWLWRLAQASELQRPAVIGAGVLGDPELVPWLIEHMKVAPLARVAGEALSMTTGVHIAYDKLEGDKPEGFEAGPTENPEDENVAMDPDEHLAWPNPDAVQQWWKKQRGNYANGTRYLAGKAMNPDSLRWVLQQGYQRQRAAAALELALRQRGSPLFEVRAPGFRQQQLLGQY